MCGDWCCVTERVHSKRPLTLQPNHSAAAAARGARSSHRPRASAPRPSHGAQAMGNKLASPAFHLESFLQDLAGLAIQETLCNGRLLKTVKFSNDEGQLVGKIYPKRIFSESLKPYIEKLSGAASKRHHAPSLPSRSVRCRRFADHRRQRLSARSTASPTRTSSRGRTTLRPSAPAISYASSS